MTAQPHILSNPEKMRLFNHHFGRRSVASAADVYAGGCGVVDSCAIDVVVFNDRREGLVGGDEGDA